MPYFVLIALQIWAFDFTCQRISISCKMLIYSLTLASHSSFWLHLLLLSILCQIFSYSLQLRFICASFNCWSVTWSPIFNTFSRNLKKFCKYWFKIKNINENQFSDLANISLVTLNSMITLSYKLFDHILSWDAICFHIKQTIKICVSFCNSY